MIGGLPMSAWILLVVAVVPGFTIVSAAFVRHRRAVREDRSNPGAN